MPELIVGARNVVPVTPPSGIPNQGRTTYTLVTQAGDIISLNDLATSGYEVLDGVLGLDMPPTTLYADAAPALDGAIARGARYEPRDVFLPIFVQAQDRYTLRTRVQRLHRAFLTNVGGSPTPLALQINQPDGTARTCKVLYAGGAEGNKGKGQFGITWQKIFVTLRAPDPWLYALNAIATTFSQGSGTNFFPLLPIHLNSNRLGTVTINNPGDVDSYPTWVWTGPGTALTLTNVLTGRSIVLTKTLGTSGTGADVVTIVTRRGAQQIVDGAGTNLWAYAPGADLWPLLPGPQTCTVSVAGATTATSVVLSYTPGYPSA